MDSEKKKIYQRLYREAKEKVEMERTSENKKRAKKGLPPLPDDTLASEINRAMKKIMEEVEERKKHTEKMEFSYKKRERDEFETKKAQEEYEKQMNKEWESYRDKRVKNWNKFKEKNTHGKKKGKYETRPPKYRIEEREENNNVDVYRPYTII